MAAPAVASVKERSRRREKVPLIAKDIVQLLRRLGRFLWCPRRAVLRPVHLKKAQPRRRALGLAVTVAVLVWGIDRAEPVRFEVQVAGENDWRFAREFLLEFGDQCAGLLGRRCFAFGLRGKVSRAYPDVTSKRGSVGDQHARGGPLTWWPDRKVASRAPVQGAVTVEPVPQLDNDTVRAEGDQADAGVIAGISTGAADVIPRAFV
ncbi:hypothetical protein ABN034_33530 [Actinopolymorpha sp. B11F2]|uniref:hypothetical protein n=1 Tax=Actinopolymorpha sp. B11F2 TaxID=3160862 RepID=UPI0032E4C07B